MSCRGPYSLGQLYSLGFWPAGESPAPEELHLNHLMSTYQVGRLEATVLVCFGSG